MQNVGETEVQSVKWINFNSFCHLQCFIFFVNRILLLLMWQNNSVRRMFVVNKLLNSVVTNLCYFGFWSTGTPPFCRLRHKVTQWQKCCFLIIILVAFSCHIIPEAASGGAVDNKIPINGWYWYPMMNWNVFFFNFIQINFQFWQ